MTGRQRQLTKTVRAEDRRAAEEKLLEWRGEVSRGSHRAPDRTRHTVRSVSEEWLEHLERAGRAPATLATYRQHLNKHILPRVGDLPIEKLGTWELDRLYTALSKTLADTTLHTLHGTISSMLRQAKRWKWISELPEPTVPSYRPDEEAPPTPAEILQLVEKARELELPHIAMLIRLAALTGLRRGELCGLRVEDLDWDAGTMDVRRQIHPDFGELPPKNGKERRVALGPVLMAELQDYLGTERDALGRERGPWVLSIDGGETPCNPKRVSEAIKRVGDAAGISVHTHSLRHFHSTYGMAAGIDIVTMAKRAGHTVDVASRTYMHQVAAADRAAAAAMEAVLSPPADD